MRRGSSTRQARSRSRGSVPRRRARGSGKPRRRRGRGGRRRFLIIGLSLVAVLAVAVAVANRERLGDTIREVTLPLRHEDIIRQQAADKDIPPDLIAAVINVESRFRDQTSDAGARGLMQITHPTADEIERLSGGETFEYDDLADPDLNIRYGSFYLRHLLQLYDGNEVAAVAAYNAGPTVVDEWGGADLDEDDIEFDETQDYVENVLDKRDDYREHYGRELGLE